MAARLGPSFAGHRTISAQEDSTDGTERQKRRKISQACDQCRARKSRCNGVKPVCGECAQRSQQKDRCRYSSTRNRDQSHDEYVSSLVARIQELESRDLGSLQEDSASETRPQAPPSASPSVPSSDRTGAQMSAVVQNLRVAYEARSVAPDSFQESPPVDAMGANVDVDAGRGHDEMYYGSSSTVSFMQQAYRTIGHEVPFSRAPSPAHDQRDSRAGLGTKEALRPKVLEQFFVLPRPLTDNIMDVYWSKVYHLYPFPYKPIFMQAYERLWRPSQFNEELPVSHLGVLGSKDYGPDNVIFHCALNSMLALGSQFMDMAPEDRRVLGDFFAKRARDMCQLDLFDDGSFAFIQALLVLGQCLQSTPYPNRCWNCIGIACRLALGLGLHVESAQAIRRLSPWEIEVRRRVWHGCVIFDTVVSMTLGRPITLDKFKSVPLPTAVGDESTLCLEVLPADRFSWLSFYIESIQIYKVLADVVSQLYGGPDEESLGSEHEGRLGTVLNIDGAIAEIESKVSEHLHPTRRLTLPRDISNSALYTQQSSVLHARYLHIRILLFRPIFMRYCRNACIQGLARDSGHMLPPSDDEVTVSVARSLSLACVKNSITLIDILHENSSTSMTGAWWYNVFYARTATIVILLAMMSETVDDAIGSKIVMTAWTKCHNIFSYLQRFNAAIKLCLQGLEKMHRHVQKFRNYQRPAQDLNRGEHAGQPANNMNLQADHPGLEVAEGNPFMGSVELGWPAGSDTAALDEIFNFDLGQAFTFNVVGTNGA